MYKDNLKITKNGLMFTDKHGNVLSASVAIKKIINRFYNWYLDLKLFILHIFTQHCPIFTIRKFAMVSAGVKIGTGSMVHMGAKFFEPKNVEIGEDTIIGDRAFLDGRDLLKIGSHTDIASEVMIYNSEHDLSDIEFKAINAPVEIGDYVFIGPRSIILPGINIGSGAVVAAGAVVTKDVSENTIVAGVPAKEIGERKIKNFKYKLGRARLFQ